MPKNKFIGQIPEFNRYGTVMVKEALKLDLIDRKILYLLGENARLSHTFIAKQLKLKRETVAYRIQRMIEGDFLQGNLTLLNHRRLGFKNYLVYFKLKTVLNEQELLTYLQALPEVTRLKNCSGTYDLQAIFTVVMEEEFLDILEKFVNQYHHSIQHYDLLEILEEDFLGFGMLLTDSEQRQLKKVEQKGSTFRKEFMLASHTREESIPDEKDKAILDALRLDATISIKDLSLLVGISPIAIFNRVGKLIRAGIIKRFIPIAALHQPGYQWWKVFLKFKNLDRAKWQTFLQQHPNILWYMKLLGKWDYQCSIFAKDNAEFHRILDEIRTEFSDKIINYDSIIVFNQWKYVQRVR